MIQVISNLQNTNPSFPQSLHHVNIEETSRLMGCYAKPSFPTVIPPFNSAEVLVSFVLQSMISYLKINIFFLRFMFVKHFEDARCYASPMLLLLLTAAQTQPRRGIAELIICNLKAQQGKKSCYLEMFVFCKSA